MSRQRSLSYGQGIGVAVAALVVLGAGMLVFELHFQAGSGLYLQDGKLSDTQATSIVYDPAVMVLHRIGYERTRKAYFRKLIF